MKQFGGRHFDYLGTVRLSNTFQAFVRRQLDDALLLEQSSMSNLKKRLAARLGKLDTTEHGLLGLLTDPEWPRQKLEAKLAVIERERAEIQNQLADTTRKLHTGRQFFTAAHRRPNSTGVTETTKCLHPQ